MGFVLILMMGAVDLRNKFRLAIGFLLLMNLVSCSARSNEVSPVGTASTGPVKSLEIPTSAPENSANVIMSASQNWVIFTREYAEQNELASWLLETDGFWTPSLDDGIKLEKEIAEYLHQNSIQFYRQPPVWERLDKYQRQYIGFKRGDKRLIYGNFFCESGSVNWHQDLVIVLDGGECFFQVEYDIDNGSFIKLRINGES
jgi:hypothetical protein